jgi:hypothetical protein
MNIAIAQERANSDDCMAKARAKQFLKIRQFTDCLVAGKSQFVQTIKLRQLEYFTAYSTRMNIVGNEADAGTISGSEAGQRIVGIEADFNQTLGAAYQQNQTERANAAAALNAILFKD